MKLNVYRNAVRVGMLDIFTNEPFFGFTYDSEYLASPNARQLSLSLPLAEARYPSNAARPFFEGLLPEGGARDTIARRLGVPRTSAVKLLGALGRDCAGDISVIEEDDALTAKHDAALGARAHEYEFFKDGLLGIAENPHEEVARLQEEMRLSLAGGQEKIALYHKQNDTMHEGWYIPLHGSPSTHIIKPGILEQYYPGITLNEFLCVRAASACGIPAVDAELLYPGAPILIIPRYDREFSDEKVSGLELVNRIHQEDCCQACGVNPELKYEHDGGPGFKQIRDLLVKHVRQPIDDIATLVKLCIFNYLIGNCDAHAKNLSILQNVDGTVSLAPAYDLISTSIYDGRYGSRLSRNMGMRIGIHENIDKVNFDDFKIFSGDVRMRLQQVRIYGEELAQKLPGAFEAAGRIADREGFHYAGELISQIMAGCDKRAKVLLR